MSFFPLDRDILTSSVWFEPHAVVRLWIYLLVSADPRNGIVRDTEPALAARCNMTLDELREALRRLSEPDAMSRTKDGDGKRIARTDTGIEILNYGRYRDKDYSAPRVRRYREKKPLPTVTVTDQPLPTVTGTTDTDTDTNTNTDNRTKEPPPADRKRRKDDLTPDQAAGFARWYTAYPHKRGRGAAEKAWAKIDPDEALIDRMIVAVGDQIAWRQNANGDFRPPWKDPATWINQKGWLDVPAPDPIARAHKTWQELENEKFLRGAQ